MSHLQIRHLRKSFGGHAAHKAHKADTADTVLHNLDLTVNSGALLALLGPSGSGKTTLLRILCGFETADAGTIDIDGQRIAGPHLHLPAEQRRIGYVPQEGALFPHLSVADNIVFGLPRAQRRMRHRVAQLLDLVGLPAAYAERAPQQLSGGQQQRVALARALAPSPRLVLLDEPFSSLDAALRVETRQALATALAAAGTTALLVTHDQAEALSLGHEVAVLWNGTLIQTATPQTLYRRPVTRELATFVGEAVLLPGQVISNTVTCLLGQLELTAPANDGPVEVMLRPEQIRLTAQSGVAATVRHITFFGPDVNIDLSLNAAPDVIIRARAPGYSSPQVGDTARVYVDGAVTVYPISIT